MKKKTRVDPTQSSRWRKAWCPDCGYTVRVSAKWLRAGAPRCGQCNVLMTAGEAVEVVEPALAQVTE